MNNGFIVRNVLLGIIPMMVAFSAVASEPVDADAAIKLARKESCLRCHGIAKKKEGPTYASVAKVYKGDPNAEEIIYKQITENPKVKLKDGHKELHKAIKDLSKDQVMNLVRWILAQ
jgi:cytochrome c